MINLEDSLFTIVLLEFAIITAVTILALTLIRRSR